MDSLIEGFKGYLNESPPGFAYEDIHSILGLILRNYLMSDPIDYEVVNAELVSIEPIIKSLSRKRERKLFCAIRGVCEKYRQSAFQEGVRIGAQLIMELSELSLTK